MKEKLENFTQTMTNFIKKKWKPLLIMLFIGMDLIPLYAVYTPINKTHL